MTYFTKPNNILFRDAHVENHKGNDKINDKVDRILKNNNHKSKH